MKLEPQLEKNRCLFSIEENYSGSRFSSENNYYGKRRNSWYRFTDRRQRLDLLSGTVKSSDSFKILRLFAIRSKRRVFVSRPRSIFDKSPVEPAHISTRSFNRDECFSLFHHGCHRIETEICRWIFFIVVSVLWLRCRVEVDTAVPEIGNLFWKRTFGKKNVLLFSMIQTDFFYICFFI